jgi:hypothetical protein
MRVEFIVAPDRTGWAVRRGHTAPQYYPDQDRALSAAENFARAAALRGEAAVVKVDGPEGVVNTRCFAPVRG